MTSGCGVGKAGYVPRAPASSTKMSCSHRFMIKRAQGRKRFGMKNFKKRWFRLTNHEFAYQKSKGNGKNQLFI